jgi:hypothetical protein
MNSGGGASAGGAEERLIIAMSSVSRRNCDTAERLSTLPFRQVAIRNHIVRIGDEAAADVGADEACRAGDERTHDRA